MEIVMLNTNVFGRPFDNTKEQRILDETLASIDILLLSVLNFIRIKTSDILFAEFSLIKDEPKREMVISLARQVSIERVKLNNKMVELADELNNMIHDYMDSLHIASAAIGKCSYLVTCDDELTKKAKQIEKFLFNKGYNVNILNPIDFLKETEGLL